MPNPSTLNAPAESWAEVRTHGQVVRYQRAGAGPAVVLLRAASSPDALWREVTDALARCHRLIVPEAPAANGDGAGWITDFLEGLGLADVALIATDPFCIPALELALLGSEQISRVVLVPTGEVGETGLAGSLAASGYEVPIGLLVVRRGLAADEAVPLVAGFLRGDGVAPPA
jgi:hypothetical protein